MQRFGRVALHDPQVPGAELLPVAADEFAGLRLVFDGPDGLTVERQLDADAARARADIPAKILRPHGQLRQDCRPDLLLCHGHLVPQKFRIRDAGGAALGRGGRFGQEDAEGGEGLFRQGLGGAGTNLLLRVG